MSVSLACFSFLAARFSFNVRPCFFASAFCGDLLDIMAPSLVAADLAFRSDFARKAVGVPDSPGHVGLIPAGCVH